MCKHPKIPCSDCPFSRHVAPGRLGGSPIQVYVGQILGPFILPCHKTYSTESPDWKKQVQAKGLDVHQCAGAAMLRHAMNSGEYLPPQLHTAPPSDDAFTSLEDFVAHHGGMSKEAAQEWLEKNAVECVQREMSKAEARRIKI